MCVSLCSKDDCCGKSCCCCCCGKRGATLCFSLIGLLLATGVIVPPVYIHLTDGNYGKIFPIIGLARNYLKQATDRPLAINDRINVNETHDINDHPENYYDPKTTYTLAIFQLLDDTEKITPCLAFVSFCMGCINVPLDIFLFFGAICKSPCLLLPWLFITMIEILVVGIPLIIYSGLISLYLASQLEFYIEAGILLGGVLVLFFVSLSSWCTVQGCYEMFTSESSSSMNDRCLTPGGELTQPLLAQEQSAVPTHPHPPPGHPGQYHLGQYPQYYPPHSNRQLPSAPPQTTPPNNGMYPNLPNA